MSAISKPPIITRLTEADAGWLSPLAMRTFLESHGHSASREDIEGYMERKLAREVLQTELAETAYHFYAVYDDGKPVGYSKIIFNCAHPEIPAANVAKLERIYTLQASHGKGHGQHLLDFNLDLAREHHQKGVWLYTWTENRRAIAFYQRNMFEIIGRHDFEISPTHTNPNHLMWRLLITQPSLHT